MRKITEKIAICVQVCITLIFVITTILYITGVIPYNDGLRDNGVFVTLLVILAIVYGLLSAYIIYINFSEAEYLRQILLFCDSESATHANVKVIRNIVHSCAKKVHGIRVRKTKMRMDEKQGFDITVKIDVNTHNVSQSVDKLRCLIADAFKNTLGLTFNSINFVIRRLKSSYKPDVEKAEKQAKTLTQQRELSADIYASPSKHVEGVCLNNGADDPLDEETENKSNTSPEDAKVVEEIREQLHENGQHTSAETEEEEQEEE
ncbi:MAG: hypothetical protein J1F68_02240 [Clostridiales bacterium]|nr:hypothetical protein [Clostridiales bacterium]